MRRISFRWNPGRAAVGGLLISVGSGIARYLGRFSLVGGMIFLAGLAAIASGLLAFSRQPVAVHEQWDAARIRSSLRKAPADATVRILQTWFPEEEFITSLRELFLHDGKRFDLRIILLLDADYGPGDREDLLAARVRLREPNRDKGVEEILTTIASLVDMKTDVDKEWRQTALPGWERGSRPFFPAPPEHEVTGVTRSLGGGWARRYSS
jgi:hypothetical protein